MVDDVGRPIDERPGDIFDVVLSFIIAIGMNRGARDRGTCERCGRGGTEKCGDVWSGVRVPISISAIVGVGTAPTPHPPLLMLLPSARIVVRLVAPLVIGRVISDLGDT